MIALAGVQLISGIAQSRAEMAAGQASSNYYEYLAQQNSRLAEITERTGRAQANVTQDIAKYEGRKFAETTAQERASQKAALASAGVTGVTAEDIGNTTLRNQLLDEAALKYSYDTKSWEQLTGATNNAYSLRSEGVGYKAAAKNELYSARLRSRSTLASSILGSAFSVFNPFKFVPQQTYSMGSYTKSFQPISLLRR